MTMVNTEKFTGKADAYDKYRPSYPDALLDYLFTEVGFASATAIADIGAGTGKLSELLLARGAHLICVEPNTDMLSKLIARVGQNPNCTIQNATAESTGLPDASIDFITVAQALHWFDRRAFRAECARILRPGGKVVVLYNDRSDGSELMQKVEARIEQYHDMHDTRLTLPRETASDFSDFFQDGVCDARVFENPMRYDLDAFLGRISSSSHAPKPDAPRYAEYIASITALFREYADADGYVDQRPLSRAFVGSVS